jgi:hypothetical protein
LYIFIAAWNGSNFYHVSFDIYIHSELEFASYLNYIKSWTVSLCRNDKAAAFNEAREKKKSVELQKLI